MMLDNLDAVLRRDIWVQDTARGNGRRHSIVGSLALVVRRSTLGQVAHQVPTGVRTVCVLVPPNMFGAAPGLRVAFPNSPSMAALITATVADLSVLVGLAPAEVTNQSLLQNARSHRG